MDQSRAEYEQTLKRRSLCPAFIVFPGKSPTALPQLNPSLQARTSGSSSTWRPPRAWTWVRVRTSSLPVGSVYCVYGLHGGCMASLPGRYGNHGLLHSCNQCTSNLHGLIFFGGNCSNLPVWICTVGYSLQKLSLQTLNMVIYNTAAPNLELEELDSDVGKCFINMTQEWRRFSLTFRRVIGPQFVSKAFNCTWLKCTTKAAPRFPHQLCHLLLSDF